MGRDETIPVLEVAETRFSVAAGLLERASQATGQDAHVLYMLALAHKRDGKIEPARAALARISRPDANTLLQFGLLSLREGQLARAEEEFGRACQADPQSFAAAYNLAMTRLSLGRIEAARPALTAARDLAPDPDRQRTLTLLDELVSCWRTETPGVEEPLIMLSIDSATESMTAQEEQGLIRLLRSLGNLDATYQLMRTLALVRPGSPAALEAHVECSLARARDLIDRCRWTDTIRLLAPLVRERTSRRNQALMNNLLGCCAYATSDFSKAVNHFENAVKLMPADPRLHQNLALALEQTGDTNEAEEHWNRFLDLARKAAPAIPADMPDYTESLEFETLTHVANTFAAKERWPNVLTYLNRAYQLRPYDADLLERLFHTYLFARQPNRARRVLDELRQARPNDPQMDLYELDLVEVKNLSDIERLLTEIEHILRRHPDDHRVRDRAVGMVGNVIPLMGNLCDQLTEQLNKVANQIRNLPRYQVDWSALREIMRDLMREFQKLRRITGKCLPLVSSDDHRRWVRELADHIDKKIDACREMGA